MLNSQKSYNTRMENTAIKGNKSYRRRKYKTIIKELGERNISLKDIASGLGEKEPGFLDLLKTTNATLDDAVILQQYAKAIVDQDTKAATFLRDTAGEAPKQQVEVESVGGGLSEMSLDELLALKKAIEENNRATLPRDDRHD